MIANHENLDFLTLAGRSVPIKSNVGSFMKIVTKSLVFAVVAGCGTAPSVPPAQVSAEGDHEAHWRALAPTCEGLPSKANCDDGDMLLFSGLLCASGEAAGCEAARQSQGERWPFLAIRAPRRWQPRGAAFFFS